LVEVELKYMISPSEVNTIKSKLIKLGCQIKNKVIEKDLYYQHPLRDFWKTDEALRLRRTENRVELTYKGPRRKSIAKVRKEISVLVSSFGDMHSILTVLGFKPVAEVVKERVYYSCPNDICVTLDDVKGLGYFIELEFKGKLSVNEAVKVLLDFANKLGIKGIPITKSYLELLLEKSS